MNVLTRQKPKSGEEVSRAIDRVLRQVFGDDAALLLYIYLEKRYSLKQDEIAEKIDIFAKGLEEILRSGAHVIEKIILEDIYSSYGLTHILEFDGRSKYDFVSQMKTLPVA